MQTTIIEKSGEVYRRSLRDEKTYQTSAGPVTLERSLYKGPDGTTICPLELQAGIIEGRWIPLAARLGYYITAEMTPYKGEALLNELGRFTASKSSLDRLSRSLGEKWESNLQTFGEVLCGETIIPEEAVTVSVSLDGIMDPDDLDDASLFHNVYPMLQ